MQETVNYLSSAADVTKERRAFSPRWKQNLDEYPHLSATLRNSPMNSCHRGAELEWMEGGWAVVNFNEGIFKQRGTSSGLPEASSKNS
ncbi:hypothetical protein AVEN_268009-1 [Araneus ventricosus]|uniref:Uncharacterized protein n=1 Tax=Araneus ventricosus TaxID=182803 RepID=A0A4Y2SVL1_ARAVE|nr:hypothetical protein AVEN_268009-1 [Araneus ventricosus]